MSAAQQTELITIEKQDHKSPVAAMILEAARDPQVDAAKLTALWELAKSIEARDAENAFNRSMMAAQAEMKPILKDSENEQTHSKYAKLEKIDRAIRPIYTKHGFALSFN